jgi:probable HAF family extracellular repeat protein
VPRLLASIVIVLVAAASAAAEQAYKIEDLGPILDPIYWSVGFNPVAVNNSGVIAGYLRQDPIYPGAHAGLRLRDGSLRDLGTFNGTPFESSQASAINARGDIAGWSAGVFYPSQAFVVRSGVMQHLGVLPGATESAAYGINDRGAVVGTGDCVCQTAAEHHALLFADGVVTDLGVLRGGRNAGALAINNRGQIVGTSDFLYETTGQHAFLYEDGHMIDLATLTGESRFRYAVDINDHGQVIGYSDTSSSPPDNRSFLYDRGSLTDLMGGRSGAAIALAINNSREIVGWVSLGDNNARAVIFAPDGPIDLNDVLGQPEWKLVAAIDVNDAGRILGYGFWRGELHGFFLEPVARKPMN